MHTNTRNLWWYALRWVNRVCPFPIEPKNHFMQFSHWNSKSFIDNRWEVLWIAFSMTIWKHRNLLVFKNQTFNPEKVMDEALFHTWSWLKGIDKDFHIHFNQWSTSLKEELSQGVILCSSTFSCWAFCSIVVGFGNSLPL